MPNPKDMSFNEAKAIAEASIAQMNAMEENDGTEWYLATSERQPDGRIEVFIFGLGSGVPADDDEDEGQEEASESS